MTTSGTMSRVPLRTMALTAATFLAACGGDDPAGPPVAGPPAMLAVASAPTTVAAGAPLTAVRVQIQDANGVVSTTSTDMVTIALAGAGGSLATLSGTLTVAAVAGVATFSDLAISQTVSGVTLAASATGLTGASSAAITVVQPVITVSPGAVDSLIGVGATILYDAIATDPTTSQPFSATIAWASDDGAVATIDPVTGLLTAAGNGTATISATTPSAAVGTGTFTSATMAATQMATFAFATNQTLIGIEWDGTNYYLTNGGTSTGEIQILDAAGVVQTTTPVTLDSRGLMYRQADGIMYGKGYNNADLLQIDTGTGTVTPALVGMFTGADIQTKPSMAADGSVLYEHNNGTIQVRDFATGAVSSTITGIQYGGDFWGGVNVQTDGQFFYTADAAGEVYVHDMQGRLVTTVTLPVTAGTLNGIVLSYANGLLWVNDSPSAAGNLFGYQLAQQ